MIVEVAREGFGDAAAAFLAGNHAVADTHQRLAAGLSGLAAMAGNDAGATEFAAAYDGAAADAVTAVADAVAAYATLGRLTGAALANHARADARSVLPGGVVADCAPAVPGLARTVLPVAPPSSLGGDPPVLTPPEAWVLDHVEGFVWPDADVARLRRAATVWRSAAQGLDDAGLRAGAATDSLLTQRSPEIPLAVAAADELRATLSELASSCGDLAAHCDAYAAEVEARHAEVRALLQEVLRFVVEGFVVGAVLSGLTAGVGAAVGVGSIAARVAAQSPRFAAVLAAFRSTTSGIAASVRATRAAVLTHRARLGKFVRVPARNERGHLTLPGGSRWEPGWLARHETAGGHTLSRHVGKTIAELEARVATGIARASSFRSQDEAETVITGVLEANATRVQAWLRSSDNQLTMDAAIGRTTGLSVTETGAQTVDGVRIVLQRADTSEGFRVHTAFPSP